MTFDEDLRCGEARQVREVQVVQEAFPAGAADRAEVDDRPEFTGVLPLYRGYLLGDDPDRLADDAAQSVEHRVDPHRGVPRRPVLEDEQAALDADQAVLR